MKCADIKELLEEYIMDELDDEQAGMVTAHLDGCSICMQEYKAMKSMIDSLRMLKQSINIKESVLNMSKLNIMKKLKEDKVGKKSKMRFLPTIAACISLALFVMAGTVIAFPSLAANYVPELPIVKEIAEARDENSRISQQYTELEQENTALRESNTELRQENDMLKMEIKKISGVEITEIITSTGISAEENQQVQELVINFIKAQYRQDLDAIRDMSTEGFAKTLDKYKDVILMEKKGELVFSSITNVAKEGDQYLVFVRLSDGMTRDDAQYQLNFELEKTDGKFLVSFVGIDV